MKTNVSMTSIKSYDALKASGFKGQHAAIVSHMEPEKVYTRRQIATMTGLETSAVAGRCNELVADGVLTPCGAVRCPITGRHVEGLKVAEAQMELLA
jgi:hypothetical protein